jgi:predicted lipid-binding transport protein (Tim44 family)
MDTDDKNPAAERVLEQGGTHPFGLWLGIILGGIAGALIGIVAGPVGSLFGAVAGAFGGAALGAGGGTRKARNAPPVAGSGTAPAPSVKPGPVDTQASRR